MTTASPTALRAQAREGAYPVPGRLNLALTLAQVGGSVALLWLASHATSALVLALAVAAFAFLMQMGFSLIHEAEHDKLHPSRLVNDAQGVLLAALFPGSYQFMKVAHLAHHRKNRADAELVDYWRPGERPWLKGLQYYLLICGLVWVGVPLLTVVIALTPEALLRRNNRPAGAAPADETKASSAQLYLAFLREARPWRVRAELAFTLALWWALFAGLDLTWSAVGWCYAAFAFSWASQQYIYHIRTPRHLVEGALNLRLHAPLRLLYLNFNYHLTHHRAPKVPWLHLPAATGEPPSQPYWRTYLRLWAPPQPVAMAHPVEHQTKGPLPPRA